MSRRRQLVTDTPALRFWFVKSLEFGDHRVLPQTKTGGSGEGSRTGEGPLCPRPCLPRDVAEKALVLISPVLPRRSTTERRGQEGRVLLLTRSPST